MTNVSSTLKRQFLMRNLRRASSFVSTTEKRSKEDGKEKVAGQHRANAKLRLCLTVEFVDISYEHVVAMKEKKKETERVA